VRKTLLVALLLALAALPAAADDAFKVVVHPSNPADALPREQVSNLFLKKVTRWPGGQPVVPVEVGAERVREPFSDAVHRKSLGAVKAYWNKLVFTGREVPPVEKSSDDEVIAFVRQNPGAVGVVSAAGAAAGVKVLRVTD
jgi:ABC-type phosphate transport system substrate-binding protein